MSGSRITIDGLWRCLCPSVNAAILTRAVSVPYRPRLARKCPAKKTTCAGPRATRALHTTRPKLQNAAEVDTPSAPFPADKQPPDTRDVGAKENGTQDAALEEPKNEEGQGQRDRPPNTHEAAGGPGRVEGQEEPEGTPAATTAKPRPLLPWQAWRETMLPERVRGTIIERILATKEPYDRFPPDMTARDVMEALRITRSKGKPRWRRLSTALVKHLLKNGTGPHTFVYETLLNTHAMAEGSALVVKDLLEEMRTKKVPWSQYAYHAAIRALAVHPDYILRNEIVREMKERWVEVLPKGHRYIALGLLRDEQYELALEKLDSMIQSDVLIDPWVFDIFIYVFGKLDFLDDALRIARHRAARGFEIPVNIWYFLLDVCSRGQNHEATTYIWNGSVQQGLVNPSDGVALNVLNMSAAYGDAELATQVIQYLAARGTRLTRPHYEALADAYNVQGKVNRAIEVYCIMYDAGAEVGHETAGTLCQALSRDPPLIDKAIEAMSELKENYKVPVGIFNAVLDETARSTALQPKETHEKAMSLYHRVREFVPAGPNSETFQTLLRRCTKPDVAQFFVGEMLSFNVRQNLDILELIFKIHVTYDGPTHRAKDYFFKIATYFPKGYEKGSWKFNDIMNLSLMLVRRLIKERDPEAWRILDVCKANGLGEDRIKALRTEVEFGKLAPADRAVRPETDEEDAGVSVWANLKSTPTADS